jgi:hypothetical protein
MWDSRHPPGTPREIWSAKVDYCIPKLRIATLTINFASKIEKFYSDVISLAEEAVEESSASSASSSDEEVESVREKEVAKAIETAAPTDIFQCITHCTSTRFSIITFSWC